MNRQDRKGYLIITASLCVIAVVGWLSYSLSKNAKFDETTLCPISGINSQTVVLIDKSDAWSLADAGRVGRLIEKLKGSISARQRLTLATIGGDESRTGVRLRTHFDKCSPGSDAECNALYQNCRRIKKIYNESFESEFQSIVDELQQPGEAATSPLFSIVNEVAYDAEASDISIHMVSDFLENGGLFSFYEEIPSAQELVDEYPIDGERVQFIGYQVERRRYGRDLGRDALAIWEEYFEIVGSDASFRRFLTVDTQGRNSSTRVPPKETAASRIEPGHSFVVGGSGTPDAPMPLVPGNPQTSISKTSSPTVVHNPHDDPTYSLRDQTSMIGGVQEGNEKTDKPASVTAPACKEISKSKYRRVSRGDSMSKVERYLGKPCRIGRTPQGEIVWLYTDFDDRSYVAFKRDRVAFMANKP